MNPKLKLTDTRNTFKPFQYPWAFDAWLKSEQSHWLHTEVPLIEDLSDWKKKLSTEEKLFLTNILRFFTQGDIDVASAYHNNFIPMFKHTEIQMMLSSFAAREALHIAAYSHLVESLGLPNATYNEFMEYKEMKDKHDYLVDFMKDPSDKRNIARNIAVFSAFTEGLQLFSSFIMLLNFPRHGKMKGLGQIISWSVADESLHFDSMIKLFRTYVEENREIWDDSLKSEIYTIATKMVELEDKFIDLAFSMGPMENLTSEDVKHYIRYIADRRLISLGLKGIFKVKKNPLLWVEGMLGISHTSFFENKSTDYSKGTLTGSWQNVWAN